MSLEITEAYSLLNSKIIDYYVEYHGILLKQLDFAIYHSFSVICTRFYASIKNIDLIELLRNVFYVGI